MNKLLGVIILMQAAVFIAVDYNGTKITNALPEASANGRDTFTVTLTKDLFRSTGTNLTMVNGWKSPIIPNQCSVNLVYSDDGTPIEDSTGLIFDLHPPARRFTITDCRKLPNSVFKPYISG